MTLNLCVTFVFDNEAQHLCLFWLSILVLSIVEEMLLINELHK